MVLYFIFAAPKQFVKWQIAGVTCYAVDENKGLTLTGSLRSIPQPTDPGVGLPGPLVIAQDVVFNPSSTGLFVAVRSNGAARGYVLAFPISGGKILVESIKSITPGIDIDFSLNFLGSDSRLLLTNPIPGTPGAAYLEVSPLLKITSQKPTVIPGQVAACWAAFSPHANSAYIIESGRPKIMVIDSITGNIRGTIDYEAPPMRGGVDAAIDRGFLYMLTEAQSPKIEVFKLDEHNDVGLADHVQSYDILSNVGALPFWMGLAIYPA